MQHVEFGWKADDDVQLYARAWQPETAPKAVACLVHGLGEHSGRYGHLAAFLTQAGYALLAFDLRGHGKSGGQRGHAPSYEVIMHDIARFLDLAAERYPQCPRFLYGHSLGGNLVLNYALRHRPQLHVLHGMALHGVVATGPELRVAFEPPAWKTTLGKLLYALWPTFSMSNGLDARGLSHDPEAVRAYQGDPLVHDQVTARLALDFLSAGTWALEHAVEFPLPLLLMHGGADPICSVQASREFAAAAGSRCTLKIWDGLYHEIHNEPEQTQVFAYLLDWLNEAEGSEE